MRVNSSVLELPPKIPYFASLFVVANARKQIIGKDILDFSLAKLKELLEAGDLTKGKLVLRFLAGLGRIVENDGIMDVIREMVSKIEGQDANVFALRGGALIVGENGSSGKFGVVDSPLYCGFAEEAFRCIGCCGRSNGNVYGLARYE
jgi:hypothetical protein